MVIHHRAVTGSTNADMLMLARDGAAEGDWLFADRQLAGRGRQGREWESPAGNIYASSLVRHRAGDPPAATLALVAGIAVHDVLTSLLSAASPVIKWPNDVVVDGAKIAGILLEREGDAVVIGIGINLASHPEDIGRPATSVAAQGGAVIGVRTVVDQLAEALKTWIARWRSNGIGAITAAWMERAHPVGTALRAEVSPGERLSGTFDGLDASGALRLRLATGAISLVHAGDVFFG